MLMLAWLLPGTWVQQNKSNASKDGCTLSIVALESRQLEVWATKLNSTISFSLVNIGTLKEIEAGLKSGLSQAAAVSCTLQTMARLVPTKTHVWTATDWPWLQGSTDKIKLPKSKKYLTQWPQKRHWQILREIRHSIVHSFTTFQGLMQNYKRAIPKSDKGNLSYWYSWYHTNIWTPTHVHDKLRKLSDINKLFAQIPLPYNKPYNVLIDMPELDDVLLATHSAVESTKFAIVVHNWKIAHLEVARRVILDDLQPKSRSLLRRKILYPSVQKKSTNCAVNVWRDWSEYWNQMDSVPDEHTCMIYIFLLASKKAEQLALLGCAQSLPY